MTMMAKRNTALVLLGLHALLALSAGAVDLCGPIITDTSVPAGEHTMSCQTFVKAGATLTIAPGATIKASTTASPAAECAASLFVPWKLHFA